MQKKDSQTEHFISFYFSSRVGNGTNHVVEMDPNWPQRVCLVHVVIFGELLYHWICYFLPLLTSESPPSVISLIVSVEGVRGPGVRGPHLIPKQDITWSSIVKNVGRVGSVILKCWAPTSNASHWYSLYLVHLYTGVGLPVICNSCTGSVNNASNEASKEAHISHGVPLCRII